MRIAARLERAEREHHRRIEAYLDSLTPAEWLTLLKTDATQGIAQHGLASVVDSLDAQGMHPEWVAFFTDGDMDVAAFVGRRFSLTMTLTKRRLMLLEENPQVQYRQELARLRRQEAIPLETLLENLIRTGDAENQFTAFCEQLTSGQCLALLRAYDNTEEQLAELDRIEATLLTLEEQARRNIERRKGGSA